MSLKRQNPLHNSTYSVDGINALSTFVSFAFDPVSVQIGEQSVDVVGTGCVTIPFLRIVSQESLILQPIRCLGREEGD